MNRNCLPCTECCRGALEAHENGIDIGYKKPCEHVTDNGCGLGEKKPQNPCKDFKCAWLKYPHRFTDDMRPDLSGCIINLHAAIFEDYDVAEAIPIKETINDKTKQELIAWSKRHKHPLIIKEIHYDNEKPYMVVFPIGSEEFISSINKMAKEGHPLT